METERQTTLFETLLPEMRFKILRLLDPRSLLNACCVNKAWYGLISPITFIWDRACRGLGLLLREGIKDKMCRALFVRLSQRRRTINERSCFDLKGFGDEYMVTTIYYHDGRLATGSPSGMITLWMCPAYRRIWISERSHCGVTSLKFDASVLAASHEDGTVRTLDPTDGRSLMTYACDGYDGRSVMTYAYDVYDGRSVMTYAYDVYDGRSVMTYPDNVRYDGCRFASSCVDFLTDADLLVGTAGRRLLVWDMGSGTLVESWTLERIATRVVVGPYPGSSSDGSDGVRKMLVAARLPEEVYVWEATSSMNAADKREVTMQLKDIVRADYVHPDLRRITIMMAAPARDELFFDGEFLYFTRHSPGNRNGVAIQWDVANGREANEFAFQSRLKALLGVGEKYVLAVTSDDCLVDNLDVMERQTRSLFMRHQIIRTARWFPEPGDIFCLGRWSWLDGFDGDNDYGPFAFVLIPPNYIYTIEWTALNWTHWIPHTQRNFHLR